MAQRKASPRKSGGQIRVLLADDDTLARKAWRKVLDSSRQIHVVDETTSRDLAKFAGGSEDPEIIVAGLSFMNAGFLKTNPLRSKWQMPPRVIMIVENREQVKAAYKNGADFATAKPFDHQDLITWVRTLGDDAKRLCLEYLDQFSRIKSGDAHDRKYCDLVNDTLQLLFHPDLVNPESARFSVDAPLCGRFVFRNQAREHRFWIDTKEFHKSKYITVDVYNKAIEPGNVGILAGYLSDTHGQMGILIGRSLQTASLEAASIAVFENEKKIILGLGDVQLRAMLEYKAGGVNPVYELECLYQRLIADAEN